MPLLNERDIVGRFLKAQDSLVLQASDLSLGSLFDMVSKKAIDLKPHYQRRERWKSDKQSALIESFILNVPVPPIYLSEDDYGMYSVIDGKQRLTAVSSFMNNELKLKSLHAFPELNGCYYTDLPVQLRNALAMRPYFRVVTLLKQTDPDLKYEVFLRLNTGGDHLKPQEIRNVAFSGPLNDLLFVLAEHPFLKERLRIEGEHSTAFRNMDDVEHVLRFLTTKALWLEMGGSLSKAMDHFMARHREPSAPELEIFHKDFTNTIEACQKIWGPHSFFKPLNHGWREQMISPLYDAQMVAVSRLTHQQLTKAIARSHDVEMETRYLFENDAKFVRSVTQATNNASNLQYRIEATYNMILSAIKA